MKTRVERRLKYFFASRHRGRADVHRVLANLTEMGELALIGGMIRDVALFGNIGFRSDLDFVINARDLNAFEKRMTAMAAQRNRFGGYTLPSRKWRIEVWPLERTWAHVTGHAIVRSFDDLQKVTFFDCDAAVFKMASRQLVARSGYFEDLSARLLGINLRPTPNPTGNAVRAFRYAFRKGFRWSRPLCQFVAETIDEFGWDALVQKELRAHRTYYLGELERQSFERALNRFMAGCSGGQTFDPIPHNRGHQLDLPLRG
jgi:hypothetical protein